MLASEHLKMYHDDEDVYSISPEQRILKLIFLNDLAALKEMKIQIRDINFLEEFKDLDVDNLICPLHLATFTGKIEIVKLLLENDMTNIDIQTQTSGFTSTSIACATGNYEILRILVENGADINKENTFNQPPLFYCFTRLQEETNVFENHLICMKMADLLLQSGALIDYIVEKTKGYTLLLQFCAIKLELTDREKEINLKVVRFLLERGANRNIKSKKGKTVYELAEKHCNRIEVQHLLKTVHPMVIGTDSTQASGFYKVTKKKSCVTEGSSAPTYCEILKCVKKC